MGAANGRSTGGAITNINVTPLVDITLVLLIIFMVTAKLIVSQPALPVDLPIASTGHEVQQVLSIVLDVGGKAQVNGATLAGDDEVLPRARTAAVTNRELRVVINADQKVPHGRVMHILDLLRQAGVSHVAFGVEPARSASDSAK